MGWYTHIHLYIYTHEVFGFVREAMDLSGGATTSTTNGVDSSEVLSKEAAPFLLAVSLTLFFLLNPNFALTLNTIRPLPSEFYRYQRSQLQTCMLCVVAFESLF